MQRSIFIDTEFNSFGGSLISIGAVSDSGSTFYGIVDIPHVEADIKPWVKENVIPVLYKYVPIADGVFDVKRSLCSFIENLNPTVLNVYADWPEDLSHFFSLFAYPNGVSSAKWEINGILKQPPVYPTSRFPHNALSDAIALRNAFMFGTGEERVSRYTISENS